MRLTRGKSGPDKDIGVRTAIAVATKCDFTLEKRRVRRFLPSVLAPQ